MERYITEERYMYEQNWHGQFSKKLAEWAIRKMKGKDGKPVDAEKLDEVLRIMKENGAELPEKMKYTAWYLWNMALADYPASLPTDEQRAYFVYETICDPDGCQANTLDCFVVKMQNAGEPIEWENFI